MENENSKDRETILSIRDILNKGEKISEVIRSYLQVAEEELNILDRQILAGQLRNNGTLGVSS